MSKKFGRKTIETELAKYYYDIYKCICSSIYPEWFNPSSNIPFEILAYMGTYELDEKYKFISDKHNDIDAVFKACIWHMGNMIYDINDRKEMIGFKKLLDMYILLSRKIDRVKFMNIYSNINIDTKTLSNIYRKTNKNTVLHILPNDSLCHNNTSSIDIFNSFKQLFNNNIVSLSNLRLSDNNNCNYKEKEKRKTILNNWRQ